MKFLTPSQQSAVLYTDGDASILAGAGSGKTLVLVEKVALLVEKLHVPPEKILVVTFTDKAAEEIKERITKRLKGHRGMESLFVGTIHAFAATLLSGNSRVMNDFLSGLERLRCARSGLLRLIDERNANAAEAVERFGLRGAVRFFLDVLSLRSSDIQKSQIPYGDVAHAIREGYQERKQALNLLDFDDLEDGLLRLLKDESRKDLRGRYAWILVDEFQDTSPIQREIFSLLQDPPRGRLVIVGDPRQSIYRFRGADPSLFLKVTREIEARGGRLFELRENFRSTSAVIDFVNRVSERLFTRDFPPLAATRREEGCVDVVPIPDSGPLKDLRALEADRVCERLAILRREGHLWRHMALLFRTRRSVPFYEDVLKKRGIPYRTNLGEPLLERPEVLSLLFLMKKFCRPSEAEARLVEEGLRHSPLGTFAETLPAGTLPDVPLPELLEALFEKTSEFFTEAARRNIAAFRQLTNDLLGLGIQDLKALVENLEALRDEDARITCPPAAEDSTDAVRLMTVHSSKGLEFPVVVLCDTAAAAPKRQRLFVLSGSAEGGEIALKEKDEEAAGLKDRLVKNERFEALEKKEQAEELEESKRLLYVALTRAQERLILPLPTDNSERDKKKKLRQNSWSEWLQT